MHATVMTLFYDTECKISECKYCNKIHLSFSELTNLIYFNHYLMVALSECGWQTPYTKPQYGTFFEFLLQIFV